MAAATFTLTLGTVTAINVSGAHETIVLPQGGTDEVTGFALNRGDVLDLQQVLAVSPIDFAAGDFNNIGAYVRVTPSGSGATPSFGGSALAALHEVGVGVMLAPLMSDHALNVG